MIWHAMTVGLHQPRDPLPDQDWLADPPNDWLPWTANGTHVMQKAGGAILPRKRSIKVVQCMSYKWYKPGSNLQHMTMPLSGCLNAEPQQVLRCLPIAMWPCLILALMLFYSTGYCCGRVLTCPPVLVMAWCSINV